MTKRRPLWSEITVEDTISIHLRIFSIVEGYHQCCGLCSVLWRIFDIVRETTSTLGIISTVLLFSPQY